MELHKAPFFIGAGRQFMEDSIGKGKVKDETTKAQLEEGAMVIRDKRLYYRHLLTAGNMELPKTTQKAVQAVTNINEGKLFAEEAFGVLGIALRYGFVANAEAPDPSTIRYTQNVLNPLMVGEATVNTRNYAVSSQLIPTELLNGVMDLRIANRTYLSDLPLYSFFSESNEQSVGGITALPLDNPILLLKDEVFSFNIKLAEGVNLPSGSNQNHYLEVTLVGCSLEKR